MDDQSYGEANLAAEVRTWIAAGESELLEFKVEFPRQAGKFAREIAAFATSNEGHILIGVSDDGNAIGVSDFGTMAGRDLLRARIEGLCTSVIKPLVQPRVRFCELDGAWVAVISVPKGPEPVYYADKIPYLRQLTASRPADPREVRDLVEAWLQQQAPPQQTSPESYYLGELLQLLVSILVQAEDAMSDARAVDPWFSSMRHRMEAYADQARDFAARTPAPFEGLEEELEEMAQYLDDAVHQDLGIGFGWDEVGEAINKARDATVAIKTKWIDEHLINSSPDQIEGEVRVVDRKLEGVARRADVTAQRAGGASELKEVSGEAGAILLRAGCFGIGFGGEAQRQILRQIGIDLRTLEAITLYMDMECIHDLVTGIREASARLHALVQALPIAK